jgi:hypothetical protein
MDMKLWLFLQAKCKNVNGLGKRPKKNELRGQFGYYITDLYCHLVLVGE